jgi:ArsR family transcriptional regulator
MLASFNIRRIELVLKLKKIKIQYLFWLKFVSMKYCSLFCEQQTRKMEESKKDYSINQEQIARFAKALGHPARIAVLNFLAKRDTCYFGDIHEELPISKATVSQHLKELKDAGARLIL